jgi:hypothetical protein
MAVTHWEYTAALNHVLFCAVLLVCLVACAAWRVSRSATVSVTLKSATSWPSVSPSELGGALGVDADAIGRINIAADNTTILFSLLVAPGPMLSMRPTDGEVSGQLLALGWADGVQVTRSPGPWCIGAYAPVTAFVQVLSHSTVTAL